MCESLRRRNPHPLARWMAAFLLGLIAVGWDTPAGAEEDVPDADAIQSLGEPPLGLKGGLRFLWIHENRGLAGSTVHLRRVFELDFAWDAGRWARRRQDANADQFPVSMMLPPSPTPGGMLELTAHDGSATLTRDLIRAVGSEAAMVQHGQQPAEWELPSWFGRVARPGTAPLGLVPTGPLRMGSQHEALVRSSALDASESEPSLLVQPLEQGLMLYAWVRKVRGSWICALLEVRQGPSAATVLFRRRCSEFVLAQGGAIPTHIVVEFEPSSEGDREEFRRRDEYFLQGVIDGDALWNAASRVPLGVTVHEMRVQPSIEYEVVVGDDVWAVRGGRSDRASVSEEQEPLDRERPSTPGPRAWRVEPLLVVLMAVGALLLGLGLLRRRRSGS